MFIDDKYTLPDGEFAVSCQHDSTQISTNTSGQSAGGKVMAITETFGS